MDNPALYEWRSTGKAALSQYALKSEFLYTIKMCYDSKVKELIESIYLVVGAFLFVG